MDGRWGGDYLGEGLVVCSKEQHSLRRNPVNSSWLSSCRTPGTSWYSEPDWTSLLLARFVTWCPQVHKWLHSLSGEQNLTVTYSNSPALSHTTILAMGCCIGRPCWPSPYLQRPQCYPEHCGHFLKIVIAVSTSITLTSLQLMNIYQEKVFPFFSVPKKIVSDRDPQFASKFTCDICQILGIEQNLSTTYHSKTNAQVEWMNHEVAQYLCIYINYHQDDWPSLPWTTKSAPPWMSPHSTSTMDVTHTCRIFGISGWRRKVRLSSENSWDGWGRRWRRWWSRLYKCQENCSTGVFTLPSVSNPGTWSTLRVQI